MSGIGKRPIVSNKFNKPNTKRITDLRVSTCTLCKRGIFARQKYKWSTLGLIHTECEIDENKNVA